MRLLIVFVLFATVEYTQVLFAEAHHYDTIGLLLPVVPLTLSTIISSFIYRKNVITGNFGNTLLKLFSVSIAGLVAARVLLFIRWYWFIAPEYRNVPNDMSIGLGFMLVFLIVDAVITFTSYLALICLVQAISRRHKHPFAK